MTTSESDREAHFVQLIWHVHLSPFEFLEFLFVFLRIDWYAIEFGFSNTLLILVAHGSTLISKLTLYQVQLQTRQPKALLQLPMDRIMQVLTLYAPIA